MTTALSHTEIVAVLRETPEQALFDWKKDFTEPKDDASRGELVKDILAIANATAFTKTPGRIFYGVNAKAPDPICGITTGWDDAQVQQLMRSACATSNHVSLLRSHRERKEGGRH